jgi:hypothetical protein
LVTSTIVYILFPSAPNFNNYILNFKGLKRATGQ